MRDGMVAKITGYNADTGGHSWTLQTVNSDGTPADHADGSTGTESAFDLNGAQVPNDTIVTLRAAGKDSSGNPIYYIVSGSGSTTILPVKLEEDGGSDGNGTTACSYTYTITDLDDNAVTDSDGDPLTGISPTHNRLKSKTMPAIRGTLGKKADGTWELYQTDEMPNFGPCTSGA